MATIHLLPPRMGIAPARPHAHATSRAPIGLGASVAGMALVVVVAADGLGASLIGDLLLFGSATSAAVYVVAGRRAIARHGLLPLLAGSAGWGVLLTPLTAVEVWSNGPQVPSTVEVLALLYLGAGCSFGAFLLSGYSLRALSAAESAVIGNLEAVIGVAAAGMVLREPIVARQIAGAALVVAGAWLATVPPRTGTMIRPAVWRRRARFAA